MHSTRNDIPADKREKIIGLLNARLAETIDLSLQAKQAHWNVKGPSFIALHELFDQVHGGLAAAVDDIAERAVALGGVAEGTLDAVSRRTKMPKYPAGLSDGLKHVEALADSLAALGKSVRAAIDESDALRDKDTADLFTGFSRELDKHLWFVEAHVQAKE